MAYVMRLIAPLVWAGEGLEASWVTITGAVGSTGWRMLTVGCCAVVTNTGLDIHMGTQEIFKTMLIEKS